MNAEGAADRRPPSGGDSLLTRMTTAAAIDNRVFPDLVEHVPGLITEGFGILAGAPKAGKSWLSLDIALACAEGGMVLGGLPTDQRAVLLLALEDGERRLQSRMRQLRAGPLPAGLNIITELSFGAVGATICEWLELHAHDETKPLVLLDTLGRARPQRRPGDDPYIADYQLGAGIKRIVDHLPGAALVAVHHTRKAGAQDWMDTVSGTQGIVGSADYILVLRRERQSDDGMLAVTGRDVHEAEYALTVTNGRWALDGPDLAAASESARRRAEAAREQKQSRLADRSLAALNYVLSRPETTPKDLASYLTVSPQIAGNLLGRLADKDLILKSGRGVYMPIPKPGESGESGESADQATNIADPPSGESGESGETENHSPPAIKALSPHSPPKPSDVASRPCPGRRRRQERQRQRTRGGVLHASQQTDEATA